MPIETEPTCTHDWSAAPATTDSKLDALLHEIARGSLPAESSHPRLVQGQTLASGRFRVVRALGEGGMGVVYEAFDAESRSSVALKTLSRIDATGVYRFKNEFRALADVGHANLVRLHELFAEEGQWFFTMELIEGVPFDRWVRVENALDEARLRNALYQLCSGVAAIHKSGQLHRDLKPSNVLVTREGRVVVLDFGLATESWLGGVGQTVPEEGLSGTPAYMAPEQIAGGPASHMTDCYALGVMLFEALTGHQPFGGRLGEVMAAKQREDAPRALDRAPSTPPDLDALCSALLCREPARRPDVAHVQAQLGLEHAAPFVSSSSLPAPMLIGREAELAQLRAAFHSTLEGQAVLMVVTGDSGIGKTALCDAFLRGLREGSAAVLFGRCREHETVPFKALDPLVDELSRYLRLLSADRAAALLPRDASALARLFPVLGRVSVFASAPDPAGLDPHDLRRRAFTAFGELLGRIRDRQPLVVCIDDLQWTDADSVAFLRHVLVHRRAIPVLLIVTHRTENAESPLLTNVLEAASSNPALRVERLELGPLTRSHTEALAGSLLGARDEEDVALIPAIASESAGSPFFATQLACFARGGLGARAALSLSSVIAARAELLPAGAQRLLEVLAVVGRPLALEPLFAAAEATPNDLDALRDAQLVRGRDATRKTVECYHDRIREYASARVSQAQRRALCAALLRALEQQEGQDPELESWCAEMAGDDAAAARYALSAAAQADAIMAFDRAATQYRRAVELGSYPDDTRRELYVKLGSALENAGRGGEAALAYRAASAFCAPDEKAELRRRAAEQLLATGQLEEGMALIKPVCREIGIVLPSGANGALATYAFHHVRLRLGQLDRAPKQHATPLDQLRLRTARTLVTGLIGYLPVHAASVACRYLLMALESGEPSDRIRGLGFNAYVQSLIVPSSRYAGVLLDQMDALAQHSGSSELIGFARLMRGTSAYHCERYTEARACLSQALRALSGCAGVDWELDSCHIYSQLSAFDCGDYAELARTTPSLVDEALRRGRAWAAAMLGGFAGMMAWLVPDDPSGYRRLRDALKRHWHPQGQPRWPDYMLLVAESRLRIYCGDAVAAFEVFEAQREQYLRSQLIRGGGMGAAGYAAHRGKCAASALRATQSSELRAPALLAIRESIKSLRRHAAAKSAGMACSLEAALALHEGQKDRAASWLQATVDNFDAAGNAMLAAAARRRLGQLLSGSEGAALLGAGDAFMQAHGVRDLEAITEVSVTGCW